MPPVIKYVGMYHVVQYKIGETVFATAFSILRCDYYTTKKKNLKTIKHRIIVSC